MLFITKEGKVQKAHSNFVTPMFVPGWSNDAIEVFNKYGYQRECASYVERLREVAQHLTEFTTMDENDVFQLMYNQRFLPNSPCLLNIGRELNQLAACFVLPIEDSMKGISKALGEMAEVQKTGGGTGLPFSSLRPAGAPVSQTRGVASGPVSFIKVFDTYSGEIKQGGVRRGANGGSMHWKHPNILEYINAKVKKDSLKNFNLSVMLDAEFFELLDTGVVVPEINMTTNELLDAIAYASYVCGDPGVLYWDNITAAQNARLTELVGPLLGVNPCGEQPLRAYEACGLGSINLAAYIVYVDCETYKGEAFDLTSFSRDIELAVTILDRIIDISNYPLPQITEAVRKTRKIGLGVMGLHTALCMLGLPYESTEARQFVAELMHQFQEHAHTASADLGQRLGVPEVLKKAGVYRRNEEVTTIAPTGTLAVFCGVSYGIEPYYAREYTKRTVDSGDLIIKNQYIEECINRYNFVPKTAMELKASEHLLMQSTIQKFTDNAVSKTINLPKDALLEDVKTIIREGYRLKLKGLTIYRDGSLEEQAMVTSAPVVVDAAKPLELPTSDGCHCGGKCKSKKAERPETTSGSTTKLMTGCGSLFVTANHNETGELVEVFLKSGSDGGCSAYTEATARLVSMALRYNIPAEEIIDQLRSVSCSNFRFQVGRNSELRGKSCTDVIGRHLIAVLGELNATIPQEAKTTEMKADSQPVKASQPTTTGTTKECPECGTELKHEEGCLTCSCGYSKC